MENRRREGSKHQRDGRDKENVNRGKEDSNRRRQKRSGGNSKSVTTFGSDPRGESSMEK